MKKKVLLLGNCGAGKTSMRSIIFASYVGKDTKRLQPTIEIEHSHVKFLGDLVLNLWDCGGQERFMENYFTSQKQNIFTNVEVLIFVLDVESRDEDLKNDLDTYTKCLNAIHEHSPAAKVFCLIHKMDLIQEDQRERMFMERQTELLNISLISTPIKIECFKTSIWDETLYKAWSSIVYELMPNVQEVENCLKRFADLMECDEVLLFERATFLIISGYERVPQRDPNRIEKVSNIIKKFKMSCSKLASMFNSMEIRTSSVAAFINSFTSNTYVMIVTSDTKIQTAAVQMNIQHAMKHFQALDRPNPDSALAANFKYT